MGLEPELELLKAVPVARDIDGNWWYMAILGMHVFIVGRTGAGKNSIGWSIVLHLAPAWRAGLVKFWGLDPKRIELSIIGRDFWDYYANIDAEIVELLEHCVDDMHARMDSMQGVMRAFRPSVETPLNIIMADEMGYLSAMMPDKRLRARADAAITTILTQGRAPGYALVGTVQDPRKDVVNYRDLFPIRICGGLNEAKMVDLVLGEGMHDAGALCEQIPLGPAGAGVAYVLDAERMNKTRLVRAPWCSDEVIRRVLAAVPTRKALTAGDLLKDEPTGQLDG
jgi:S-DNA-T family DNA segregation ATPase FtsK/SpoIIIE